MSYQPTPKPRSTRKLALIGIGIAAVAVLAALGGIGGAMFFDKLSGSAAPSPSVSRVDEEGTCAVLIPTGREVVDHIIAFAAKPDGSTTDWAEVEETVRDLETIRAMSAPDFHADIDAQIGPLKQMLEVHSGGADREISFTELRAAGLHIAARCMQYAD